jgi:hypothetical protein
VPKAGRLISSEPEAARRARKAKSRYCNIAVAAFGGSRARPNHKKMIDYE